MEISKQNPELLEFFTQLFLFGLAQRWRYITLPLSCSQAFALLFLTLNKLKKKLDAPNTKKLAQLFFQSLIRALCHVHKTGSAACEWKQLLCNFPLFLLRLIARVQKKFLWLQSERKQTKGWEKMSPLFFIIWSCHSLSNEWLKRISINDSRDVFTIFAQAFAESYRLNTSWESVRI